ncbi:hypothetical protein HK102_007826, partial [Quaeritorhiza haematococci]
MPSNAVMFEVISGNPVLQVRYYDLCVKILIEKMFGWDMKERRPFKKGGIFGISEALFIEDEAQGRGTPHHHGDGDLVGMPRITAQLHAKMEENGGGANQALYPFKYATTLQTLKDNMDVIQLAFEKNAAQENPADAPTAVRQSQLFAIAWRLTNSMEIAAPLATVFTFHKAGGYFSHKFAPLLINQSAVHDYMYHRRDLERESTYTLKTKFVKVPIQEHDDEDKDQQQHAGSTADASSGHNSSNDH